MLNKYYISERYLYDPENQMLHDLKGSKDPENAQCRLNCIQKPLLFDSKKLPAQHKKCSIKTAGGKRSIIIQQYCPFCINR